MMYFVLLQNTVQISQVWMYQDVVRFVYICVGVSIAHVWVCYVCVCVYGCVSVRVLCVYCVCVVDVRGDVCVCVCGSLSPRITPTKPPQ